MAELKENSWGIWFKCMPLIFLALIASIAVMIWGHGNLHDYVAKQCPDGTFLSGETYQYWEGLALVVMGTLLFYGTMEPLTRHKPFTEYYRRKFGFPFGGRAWVAFSILLLISASVLFLTSTAQFCLSARGIGQRVVPWQQFRTYAWTDVAQINAVCQRGGRWGWDLKYALTMKGGHTIDIADAFPSRAGLAAFKQQLTGIPFSFQATIRPGCAEWYSDWVGQRP